MVQRYLGFETDCFLLVGFVPHSSPRFICSVLLVLRGGGLMHDVGLAERPSVSHTKVTSKVAWTGHNLQFTNKFKQQIAANFVADYLAGQGSAYLLLMQQKRADCPIEPVCLDVSLPMNFFCRIMRSLLGFMLAKICSCTD